MYEYNMLLIVNQYSIFDNNILFIHNVVITLYNKNYPVP